MVFKGKNAIVTGGGRGLGKAIAINLGLKGANVVLVSSSEEALNVKSEFEEQNINVLAFKVDIRNAIDIEEMVNEVVEKFGGIDILVNNAGITKDGFMLKASENDWDDVIDINLKGTYLCIKSVVKHMMQKQSGKIINISSIIGEIGNMGQTNYAASKAGLFGLTKSVAKEFASKGITCNAVAPGFIDTQMLSSIPQKVMEEVISSIPLKRLGKPEEIASMVSYLASEEANYITGQVFNVNGGLYV